MTIPHFCLVSADGGGDVMLMTGSGLSAPRFFYRPNNEAEEIWGTRQIFRPGPVADLFHPHQGQGAKACSQRRQNGRPGRCGQL